MKRHGGGIRGLLREYAPRTDEPAPRPDEPAPDPDKEDDDEAA